MVIKMWEGSQDKFIYYIFWEKFQGCNQNHKISHLNYQRKVIQFHGHGLVGCGVYLGGMWVWCI